MRGTLYPDLKQAAAMIRALTGTNGWNTPMTYQVVDDSPAKRRYLSRILHGTLTQRADELTALNRRGAAICVTVQETDLHGRTMEHITRPRALFIDHDSMMLRKFALQPSMCVFTARGVHAYWLLERARNLAIIPRAQRQLAAFYGSDMKVCDITRTMRLPGYFHCKGDPIRVTLYHCAPEVHYRLLDVLAAHPVPAEPKPRTVRWRHPSSDSLRAFRSWAMCRSTNEGSRNHNAFVIAAEGLGRGFEPEEVREVVYAFCARCGIEREAETVVASALRRHARQPFTSRTVAR
jgi:hypothetical protein